MARKPGYWQTLQASKDEAMLAVDLYNGLYDRRLCPLGHPPGARVYPELVALGSLMNTIYTTRDVRI
ncbi:MAG TPA: hypothetical protein DEV93_09870 [Chloroflexi bacterium]|jgi:hypothetical protein|nr:hypothetical protein [Chloroflexota bacterium]